jgi:hypothetical protein
LYGHGEKIRTENPANRKCILFRMSVVNGPSC